MATIQEAVEELKLTESLVRRYCRSGRLKADKRGRDWWIAPEELYVFKLQKSQFRPGRPRIDPIRRAQTRLCKKFGLPDDIVITEEEAREIDENLDWFLTVSPTDRLKLNLTSQSWLEELRHAGRSLVRSA